MLPILLLLCGDIESNPGPVFKRCAVCGVMQKDSNVSYFSYPKDPERAALWNNFLSQHTVYSSKQGGFVCALHFEPRMFLNDLRNRLQQHAVPTVWRADTATPLIIANIKEEIPEQQSDEWRGISEIGFNCQPMVWRADTATMLTTADIKEEISEQQSDEWRGISEIGFNYHDDNNGQAERQCMEITDDKSTIQLVDSQHQLLGNQAGCSIAVINYPTPVTRLPKRRTRDSCTMTIDRLSSNTPRKVKLRRQVKTLSRAKSRYIKQISTLRLKFSEYIKRQSKARSVESLIKEIGQYLHGENLDYVAHLLRTADQAPKAHDTLMK